MALLHFVLAQAFFKLWYAELRAAVGRLINSCAFLSAIRQSEGMAFAAARTLLPNARDLYH